MNKVLKAKNPGLKVILSIGGWTWSGPFSDIAVSPGARSTFAQACANLVQTYGFDGIDIDWEYPVGGGLPGNSYRPNDGANYVLLLKDVREALNKLPGGNKLELAIAGPAALEKIGYMDVAGMNKYLDYLNVMTYDFRGGWSPYTGH